MADLSFKIFHEIEDLNETVEGLNETLKKILDQFIELNDREEQRDRRAAIIRRGAPQPQR